MFLQQFAAKNTDSIRNKYWNYFLFKASASPMISPGNSPRPMRRSMTPGAAPPPLPPRRSSPTHEPTILPTTSAHSLRNGLHYVNGATSNKFAAAATTNNGLIEAQSVTNLTTHSSIDIPQIAKSSSMLEMHRTNTSGSDGGSNNDNNNVIELSSPETIYGVVISNCDNIINTKSQTRHLSCPSTRNKPQSHAPVKSNTTPNISSKSSNNNSDNNVTTTINPVYENAGVEIAAGKTKQHQRGGGNLKINPLERDSTVSYENLNMDYIKKLVSEGYSKDSVIKALGITRNNVDMACDILHEFGTKLGG